MLFLSREGIRRRLPIATRVRRARSGLGAAVAQGRVFHLWMHVEDLVPEPEAMLDGLAQVLLAVRDAATRGDVVIRTMSELAA